jgi:hypothetical protein
MVVLAKMTAKRSERGGLHPSADTVVLLDEFVGMAVFNKRIDNLTGGAHGRSCRHHHTKKRLAQFERAVCFAARRGVCV